MTCLDVVPSTQDSAALQQWQKYRYHHPAASKLQAQVGLNPGSDNNPTSRSPRRSTRLPHFNHATPDQSSAICHPLTGTSPPERWTTGQHQVR